MKVTYTGKMEVGGSGIGTTAWHQVKPLLEEDLIEMVYASGNKKIPKEKCFVAPSIEGPYLYQDIFFDAMVSQIMIKPPEILQTWGSHCLFQLREFPDAISIVNLYSAHPAVQWKLLQEIAPPDPYLARKMTKELELCNHIFIPSEWILDSLRKVGLDHKAKLVPFGVDLEKFTPRVDEKDDIFRVIYVGSNWMRKGLTYLILAWEKLKLENAELIVAGVDKLPSPKISDNIKIGWVEDLAEAYRYADVFCLPTIEDGCPLATYEAMASGLPVIISENTGTTQHVYPGTNGFIVPPHNINSIIDYLKYSSF